MEELGKAMMEESMKKLYPTSEKHFIKVVYQHFMNLLDNPTMEDKEKIARVALDLHKQYFHCCMRDIEVADKD